MLAQFTRGQRYKSKAILSQLFLFVTIRKKALLPSIYTYKEFVLVMLAHDKSSENKLGLFVYFCLPSSGLRF